MLAHVLGKFLAHAREDRIFLRQLGTNVNVSYPLAASARVASVGVPAQDRFGLMHSVEIMTHSEAQNLLTCGTGTSRDCAFGSARTRPETYSLATWSLTSWDAKKREGVLLYKIFAIRKPRNHHRRSVLRRRTIPLRKEHFGRLFMKFRPN